MAKIMREVCGFLRDIWHKVSPTIAILGRPEGEEGPINGVNCGHDRPESVNVGDIARDNGDDISRQGSCST